MLVILAMRDGQANFMQLTSSAQDIFIGGGSQAPLTGHLLPGGKRGLLDGGAVSLIDMVALLQGRNGALPDIFVLNAPDNIVQQAFPKSSVGKRHLLNIEGAKRRQQNSKAKIGRAHV